MVGNPMTVLLSQSLSLYFSLGTSTFICTRGISMSVCACVRVGMLMCMHVRYINGERRGERWSVSAYAFMHAHLPEVAYHGVNCN